MTAATRAAPVNWLPLLYIGAAVVGVLVVLRYVGKIGGGVRDAVDTVTRPLADAYVSATTDQVEAAPGTYFVLPGGTTVAPDDVEHLGGGLIRYLGVRYKLTASLGGGRYQAERA